MSYKIEKLDKSAFPKLLQEITDPPKNLYVAGEMPSNQNKFLCVVGSRKYSTYGRDVCESLILGLSGLPVVIVSGLALGIDSIAHKAALKAGIKTVAVPGSGLNPNVLYPSSHKQLAQEIIDKGGALLSEYEPDFKATTWSFPKRNRIMAGLSHATLVIEAEIKSGTLITSKVATEYNRDVFTVPGSIFSSGSEGPHMLLRLGATPITNSLDLIKALGLSLENKGSRNYEDCSPDEIKILELLKTPMERDVLIQKSGLGAQVANTIIATLELKDYISESLGEIRLN